MRFFFKSSEVNIIYREGYPIMRSESYFPRKRVFVDILLKMRIL